MTPPALKAEFMTLPTKGRCAMELTRLKGNTDEGMPARGEPVYRSRFKEKYHGIKSNPNSINYPCNLYGRFHVGRSGFRRR